MGSSVSLFHFDGYATNRQHEDRFQFFIVEKGESVRPVGEKELKKLLDAKSDDIALMSAARLLGTSLERESYDLFIESLGPLSLFFYDSGAEHSAGFTDFEETKNLNYDTFRLFKFVSFLDLLRPGSVAWRGQTDLRSFCVGLQWFEELNLQGRTSMLSRWIQNPGPSAFSEERASEPAASRRNCATNNIFLRLLTKPIPSINMRVRIKWVGRWSFHSPTRR